MLVLALFRAMTMFVRACTVCVKATKEEAEAEEYDPGPDPSEIEKQEPLLPDKKVL